MPSKKAGIMSLLCENTIRDSGLRGLTEEGNLASPRTKGAWARHSHRGAVFYARTGFGRSEC